ncbi:MAG: glycosyl hydrolase, partial [Planctomycetota bacterium]
MELGGGGISTRSWTSSAGGESAFLAFDPDNPRYVMGGSYLGTIEILDTKASASTNIMSAPIQYLGRAARDMRYLYNWNAPIIWSQHEPDTYYHAAQYLLRTKDRGKTWVEVSPDLTRNQDNKQGKGGGPLTNEAVGAENYGTISYVAESPHEKGVLWTGSDDGLVHVTKNGGEDWIDVTPQDLEECLINAIEVSPHDPATVYIATTRYKFDDKRPGIYKTTDFGKTWNKIVSGIPEGAFTRVVREDEDRKDLLFAGTEIGLYVSWNGGEKWEPFQLNLPVTPILDLAVRHGDLIAATSGRAFWILDDLALIRQHDAPTSNFHLFEPEPSMLSNHGSELSSTSKSFTGSHPFRGINPANGVIVYYTLPKLEEDEHIALAFMDASGETIVQFSSEKDASFQSYAGGPPSPTVIPKEEGLNRFVWNMRHRTMPGIPKAYIEASYRGHKVMPGTYSIKLTNGDDSVESSVEISAHPLYETTPEQYKEYDEAMTAMESELISMHDMTNRLHRARVQLDGLLKTIPEKDALAELKKSGEDLSERLKSWDEEMVQRKSKAYDDVENFPNKFTAEYLFLINQTESAIPKVTQGSLDRREELDEQWKDLKKRGKQLIDSDIPKFNELLWANKIGAIWAMDEE